MSHEYTLHYARFGESLQEGFDTLDDALTRSAEILTRNFGCSRFITRKGAVIYEQESLFNDWMAPFRPENRNA